MNIFRLNNNPAIAAQDQCDKHVVKMPLESAQMLCTAHRMLDGVFERRKNKNGNNIQYFLIEDEREDVFYKAVHFNHPSTVWTRECLANYQWHYDHFIALCDEYTFRYGKVHAADTKLREILKTPPKNIKKTVEETEFKLAMKSNPECMLDDPVESYRAFYQTKQDRFSMVWTKRSAPEWFNFVDKSS